MASSNIAPTCTKPSPADRAAAKAESRRDRVPLKQIIPWSAHSFSMNALIVLIGYFTIYATDTLMLNPAVVGGLLVGAKVVDAAGALFAGYIVERAPESRMGKARPFELVVILCWATTALMFAVPGGLGEVAKYVWLFTSYSLLTALFMPLYNANNPLFTARVFPRREHYTDVAAKGGLVTVLVAIVITVGMPLAIQTAGKDPSAWSFVVLCIAVPSAIVGLIRFWLFRESPDAAVVSGTTVRIRDIMLVLRTNRYMWMLSALSLLVGFYSGVAAMTYYFRYVVGNLGLQGAVAVAFVVLIPVMVFFPKLIRRFSVSHMIAVSSFIGVVGYFILMFAGASLPLIMLSAVLTALAALPFNFLAPILVIDNATYNEWKGHRRLESVGGAFFSFAGTVGQALAAGVTGVVLALTGYVGAAEQQTPAAIQGIIATSSWIPAIFAFAVGVLALFYHRLEHKMKGISAEVLARRKVDMETEIIPGAPLSGTEAIEIVRAESKARSGWVDGK
ncbi:MFS transporter [Arthrobacter sp. W4I7]|uniref:MFS transporter n=1 Tax=Arthrobacter sp. W4I7 TaxID=3042296 RepID=UPI00277D8648|nr:MFS transporter [Arthrobacter sp. W4I7]MDQ0691315.1 Na+/melibiose symporter-like transporter [Arthrobacter sp. W4I7]